jgi:hypothetical protein
LLLCPGTCPEYNVTVHGDGRTVLTTGTRFADPASVLYREWATVTQDVVLPGAHDDRIAPGHSPRHSSSSRKLISDLRS